MGHYSDQIDEWDDERAKEKLARIKKDYPQQYNVIHDEFSLRIFDAWNEKYLGADVIVKKLNEWSQQHIYTFFIDGTEHKTTKPTITGKEIKGFYHRYFSHKLYLERIETENAAEDTPFNDDDVIALVPTPRSFFIVADERKC